MITASAGYVCHVPDLLNKYKKHSVVNGKLNNGIWKYTLICKALSVV